MDYLSFRSVVVTGGGGFVGRHLVPALSRRLAPDATLHLLGLRGRPAPRRINQIAVDLRDAAGVEAALSHAKPDLIIHLAAQSSVARAIDAAGTAETWSVNLSGTLNLAQACANHSFAGTFVFVSTADVYGRAFNEGPVDEASPLLPQSAYGRSKAAAEAMLGDVLPEASQLIILRPGNHSGPGQDDRFVLPSFARQIASIEVGAQDPVLNVGNLEAEREFLDVRDVIDAYLALLAVAPALGKREVFNIGSGKPVRIATLLDELVAMSSAIIRVQPDPTRMRPSEITRVVIDSRAFRAATGWQPTRSIENMLVDILNEERGHVRSAAGAR